jgi:hypothetical protein
VPTDTSTPADDPGIGGRSRSRSALLLSRIVVAWVELTIVGFVGAALASATSGPPRFVVFLGTTLLTVGVLFYNVDGHVTARLAADDET